MSKLHGKNNIELKITPINEWMQNDVRPLIVSGPCSAESEEQVLATAAELAKLNRVSVFRAGIWKPRTRPNSFEGVGNKAFDWLKKVKEQYGFKIAIEVATAEHVNEALKNNIDILWIGARTSANPFSVQAIADALEGIDIPVFVKNPIHADLQLWIGALERINKAGVTKLAAVHRGFYSYERGGYRYPPHWELPIELKTIFPNLPVLCDPSHICGKTETIEAVAQKALDLNFDGLMIETHINPAVALSDKEQQLTPSQLGEMLQSLVVRKENNSVQETEALQKLRNIIDELDAEIVAALANRMRIAEKLGAYKKENNITIFQLERWLQIVNSRGAQALEAGLSKDFIQHLYNIIHRESIRVQNNVMNESTDKVIKK